MKIFKNKLYIWGRQQDFPGKHFIPNGQANVTFMFIESEILNLKYIEQKLLMSSLIQ